MGLPNEVCAQLRGSVRGQGGPEAWRGINRMRLQRLTSHGAAFLLAALAPAIAAAALTGSIKLLPFTFGVAFAHALGLGLPLFLIFRLKRRVNLISSVGIAFIVGALPMGVLTWPLAFWRAPGQASINGVPTVVDGLPTAAGWFYYVQTLVYFGLFGALAGFVFWIVLRISGEIATRKPSADHGSEQTGDHFASARTSALLGATAVLLTSVVLAIPTITKDRSCHNMFRDGRQHVTPMVSIELHIDTQDWPKLAEVFKEFASAHALSFRDSRKGEPGVFQLLGLSLCNEHGINIEADAQQWASAEWKASALASRGVHLGVFELQKDSGWEQLARDLMAKLESAWHGKVTFRNGEGRPIPMPRELQRSN